MQPPQVTYTPREESQWLAVLIDARTGRFMDQLDVFGTPTVDDTVNQTTRVAISVPKRQARDLVRCITAWRCCTAIMCWSLAR